MVGGEHGRAGAADRADARARVLDRQGACHPAAGRAGATTADAFIRLRYGDGFSHARALALQTCLSLIPLAIALIGLASALGHEAVGAAAGRIVLQLAPGQRDALDDVVRQTQQRSLDQSGHVALWLGLGSR